MSTNCQVSLSVYVSVISLEIVSFNVIFEAFFSVYFMFNSPGVKMQGSRTSSLAFEAIMYNQYLKAKITHFHKMHHKDNG